mmetsp:Transcript_69774/g.220993  ORF Transcript_69774/g.220993 Transcript_69774/m.220993 type:complete len:274 (+) Transcript_69774:513-1334(+)
MPLAGGDQRHHAAPLSGRGGGRGGCGCGRHPPPPRGLQGLGGHCGALRRLLARGEDQGEDFHAHPPPLRRGHFDVAFAEAGCPSSARHDVRCPHLAVVPNARADLALLRHNAGRRALGPDGVRAGYIKELRGEHHEALALHDAPEEIRAPVEGRVEKDLHCLPGLPVHAHHRAPHAERRAAPGGDAHAPVPQGEDTPGERELLPPRLDRGQEEGRGHGLELHARHERGRGGRGDRHLQSVDGFGGRHGRRHFDERPLGQRRGLDPVAHGGADA